MNKLTKLALAGASILCIIVMINNPVYAQNAQPAGSKPIPENIVKIAEKSCLKCHVEHGNAMAESHVNLTNWAEYSPEKQASKAKAMCKMVTKGKMPPKNFRKEHPDGIPSPEEVKAICDWAQSLQPAEKK